jgi:hypothetical protein
VIQDAPRAAIESPTDSRREIFFWLHSLENKKSQRISTQKPQTETYTSNMRKTSLIRTVRSKGVGLIESRPMLSLETLRMSLKQQHQYTARPEEETR